MIFHYKISLCSRRLFLWRLYLWWTQLRREPDPNLGVPRRKPGGHNWVLNLARFGIRILSFVKLSFLYNVQRTIFNKNFFKSRRLRLYKN